MRDHLTKGIKLANSAGAPPFLKKLKEGQEESVTERWKLLALSKILLAN